MSRLAFLGELSEGIGFKAFGFEHYQVQDDELPALEWEEYTLIVLTEEIYQQFQEYFTEVQNRLPQLNFLLVPSERGKLGLAENRVRYVLGRIVGSDILARREV
jgi:vacuolar-type H+-ATPase subunit F/Vma7